ncbi:BLUF domain-containing protein [Noviherbaspirillum sp.]|mgnify:CR=1 FL=1|uniref:BLUF domain-containing protein n=1 Tax=Noviherbaspirillum sp. TaxID=1926288 RepID=UPI002FE2874F
MLVRLIYASRVQKNTSQSDVREILEKSVANNGRAGVTGALCFTGGIFLQCLEGDRREVSKVYHRILNDTRHADAELLMFEEVAARNFSDWNMGYLGYTQENRSLFLKYSSKAEFDPYSMSEMSLRAFFDEMVGSAKWLGTQK